MKFLYLIVVLLAIILGVSFSVLNAVPVNINYYFGYSVLPLSVVLVSALAVGGVMGIVASLSLILRIKFENMNLKKKVKLVEKEIANLRTLPLQDSL